METESAVSRGAATIRSRFRHLSERAVIQAWPCPARTSPCTMFPDPLLCHALTQAAGLSHRAPLSN
eukprot:8087176-Pyramimonas_sp.AAC.1